MRILIIEDEPTLAKQLEQALRNENYAVDCAHNGVDGHYLGSTEPYDAIILDLGLPKLDGLSVLKKWRDAGIRTPVLILTARDSWHARLRALIRRSAGHASAEVCAGALTLDSKSQRILLNDYALDLTSHEYKVLAYLILHKNKVVSRTELTEHIYAQDFDKDSNTIEVFIGRLRKKIPKDLIETVRGLGYVLKVTQ
jgi:two-component system OmpR family response regulator